MKSNKKIVPGKGVNVAPNRRAQKPSGNSRPRSKSKGKWAARKKGASGNAGKRNPDYSNDTPVGGRKQLDLPSKERRKASRSKSRNKKISSKQKNSSKKIALCFFPLRIIQLLTNIGPSKQPPNPFHNRNRNEFVDSSDEEMDENVRNRRRGFKQDFDLMKTTLKVENAEEIVNDEVFDYQEKVDDVLEMHDEILAMHMNILKVKIYKGFFDFFRKMQCF